ncbi:hypothetical protein AAG570_003958 [Ranatra chinensis]|uniref:GYF domain-containing protein n=1 Tax=Ranatra chinensis TaxID=642074 RepID=A0ABD0YGY2_9HEMI
MAKRKIDGSTCWEGEQAMKKVKNKNSLDSDEEDDEPDNNKYHLQDDDIEGQEEGGVMLEEGMHFTPFNMKEEMEEGHFDTDGMYHWKKDKEVKDSWLENIDWVKVKEKTKGTGENSVSSDDDLPEAFDTDQLYKKILSYLKPKESIAKALQRLGGKKSLSASERLKLKKAGLLPPKDSSNDSQSVIDLTELANKILTHLGNMDIYQETYEQIQDRLGASSSKSKKEPVLDMYADDFGSKEKEMLNETTPVNKNESTPLEVFYYPGNNVMWELKRKMENEDVEGPYSTVQMEKWAQCGEFGKEGVFVRKCGSLPFYNSNRVDFDLYL